VELRQFEAFNRLAAYVAHDLKNILAQQSLLVDNSRVYRDDPEFVDDAFKTIEHSVKRMRRLMEQMRSGQRGADKGAVDTGALLEEICHRRAGDNPAPQLTLDASEARVLADRDQLANVFGHLVQNAQEATPDDGSVAVTLGRESGRIIVEVKDTGCGMDEAFLRERLFKPFDTTKGLTGMGIGVVESRDVIRGLGGEMEVTSAPGKGSVELAVG
jgi:putative PEP-CTERM system histidine kinase